MEREAANAKSAAGERDDLSSIEVARHGVEVGADQPRDVVDGERSDERTRMNDRFICSRAGNEPMSASCEMTARTSASARHRISSSGAAASPTSRTTKASCPAATSSAATRGDTLASTRNLRQDE
jgi:hypothetical protein